MGRPRTMVHEYPESSGENKFSPSKGNVRTIKHLPFGLNIESLPRREGQGDRSPRRRQALPRRFQRSKPSRAQAAREMCGPVPAAALTSAARTGGRTWRLAPPTLTPSCTHPHAAGPMQQSERIELHGPGPGHAPNPPDGSPRGKLCGPEANTFSHAQAEDEIYI
jgi:hypothetical protein